MSANRKPYRSNFLIKLTSWEYWPFGILQFPLFIYWLWLSLRARSLLFFSASNPGIPMGGMFGESKYDILKKIPERYKPRTLLLRQPLSEQQLIDTLHEAGFRFPLIFKPDLGERGYLVKRIDSAEEAIQYLRNITVDFLAQELVLLPLEFGVFYERKPNQLKGRVTSVVAKEMLSVTGDGQSSLQQLIFAKDRAKLQWTRLRVIYAQRLEEVLPTGEKLELVSIGNHALGTKFLDGTHLINEQLHETFDSISKQIPGFFFGRYDIRCASLEDLYAGRIMIMELNGCGAEPAHIYQPGFPVTRALAVMFRHWRQLFEISRENKKQGVPYTTLKEGYYYYRKFKAAIK